MDRRTFLCALTVGALSAPLAAEAQPPIRIGATVSQTGPYAALGQDQLRGYQLCVKHMNDRGEVLGRKLELVVYDDRFDPATAVRLYEKLITQDKVDLVLAPFSGPITDAVADVTEKYKMPMVAPGAGAVTPIYNKGRKFIFSVLPPAEVALEGLIDLAAKKGLKTVALINVDDVFGWAATQGAIELAKKRGLQVVVTETYSPGNNDFSTILTKVQAVNPDVLGGVTRFEDAVAITRQLKVVNVNPRMVGLAAGVDTLKFYEVVGRDGEFVYGNTPRRPELGEGRDG